MRPIEAETEVRFVPGVGPRRAEALREAGVATVEELLLQLPFRYEDRSVPEPADVREGEATSVEARVEAISVRPTRRRNLRIVEMRGTGPSGPVVAVWFNQLHLLQILRPGRRVLLYGKVKKRGGGALELGNPRHELIDEGEPTAAPRAHIGRVVPVYERIGPLTPRMLRGIIHRLVEAGPPCSRDGLPDGIARRLGLPDRQTALRAVHGPPEGSSLDEYASYRSPAHRRLIIEEFFLFSLWVLMRRREHRVGRTRTFRVDDALRDQVRAVLPFRLTPSQRKTLRTLAEELQGPRLMRRLLQGDVGSGKTIVAVIAALIVIHNGAQAALMAPTEVLAEQHFGNIERMLRPHGVQTVLLTAGLSARDRQEAWMRVRSGDAQFIVGTHALIQENSVFHDLGFAVVDEQHRFGVAQRKTLLERGGGCDLLVMTATPIPRTLTMALHGDLEVSELRDLPPGRQPIRTLRATPDGIEDVYRRIREQVAAGHQAYYVCPLIEESEELDASSVETRFRELAEGPLRRLRVGCIHGRMPASRREPVMAAFAGGRLDVLVATTVIEVGVDVPNATIMVIENAERFGLAQLHQLRGRVGRGRAPSTVVLIAPARPSEIAARRIGVMESTTDGFRIAEEDLAIRGPGDFFGTRQSGMPAFRVADFARDAELFRVARREAEEYLASPEAATEEGAGFLARISKRAGERFTLAEAG